MTPGQELTAHFCDEVAAIGKHDMIRMKGHVAKRAKELLDILTDDLALPLEEAMSQVKEAITVFIERHGRTPLQIAEIATELARVKEDPSQSMEARRCAKAWIELHGWPTGAKFVRGSHAGTYKFDPLGTEKLPMGYGDWPHKRPAFDDVVRALVARCPLVLDGKCFEGCRHTAEREEAEVAAGVRPN